MLRIFPRIRRSQSRANGSGTRVRPVRIAVASILAATASVFVITAVASAHDVYSTTVYSGGSTVYDGSSPDGPSYTNGLQGTSGTTGTAISNGAILNAPATVYDTAKVQNESSNTSVTMTFNLYFGSVPTGCPTTGPNTNKTPIPSGWLQQEVIPANPSPSFPEYTASWGGNNWLYGTSVSPTFNTITTPGNYYFVAYTPYDDPSSGLNFTFGITCEPFTVQGKASPSINTVPSSGASPSSIGLGQSFTDTATLTGAHSPTGSITFDVYNNANCTGTVLFTSTNGLSGNSATSGSYTPTSAGNYYIAASYPGDAKNNGVSSACANEEVIVGKASPSLSTVPSSPTVNLGSSFTDTATLTGGSSPAGTVTFDVYNSTACSGAPLFTGTGTVSGGVAHSTSLGPVTATGSYYIAASYPGDGNNASASSPCTAEVVTVGKVTPSVTTALLTSAINPLTGLYDDDVATVSGGSSPTGTVTFNIYTTNNCTGAIWNTSLNALNGTSPNGPTAQSNSFGPFSPGTMYYFVATYNGDGNNNPASSPCISEPLTVSKVSPTLSTNLSSSTVALNGSFSDSATLSGASSPTGSVTFTVYTNSGCTTLAGFSSTNALSGNSATSSTFGPLTTSGKYYVAASYPGDGNNNPASSPCTAEVVTVGMASPTLTTNLSSSTVALNGSFSDTATLNGAVSPTGSVTFTVYTDSGCTTLAGFSSTNALSGNSATSSTFGPLTTAGTYYVAASYPGDANNNPASSPCTAEQVVVSIPSCTSGCGGGGGGPPTASLATTPSVTGLSATDSATVTGTGGTPTGSVTFTLYSGTSGSGTLVTAYAADTVTLNGSGTATSVSTGPLTPGSYYFLVSYSGDSNYAKITPGTAEPFSINPNVSTTPAVTGSSATDTANVTGTLGTPTGTVTFVLYSGSPGSGTLVAGFAPETVTLVNGSATSTSTGSLAAGNYYFEVSYSGDSNYPAITPGSPEPFTIIVTSPPTPVYKIPTSAPQTGAGGMAGVTFNGGLLALGSLMLLAGLSAMALMLRRRRNA